MRLCHLIAFSLIFPPLACTAQADSLAEEIAEIHHVDEELAALGGVARAPQLAGQAARLKQGAIDHAVVAFGIDLSALPAGVHYSPHGNMRERDGATFLDRDGTLRVLIGDRAFRSPAWLGSTIAHEVEVHVNRQIAKGRNARASDGESVSIQEIEAYDFEIASQARFGMHADEGKVVRQRRMDFYRTLQYENRVRVDAGVYVKQ